MVTMDDRSPAKLLLCAKDVLTGVVQPWHTSFEQRELINVMREKLELGVAKHASDEEIYALLTECIEFAKYLVTDTQAVHTVTARYDRVRLTFQCLLTACPKPK